MGKEKSISAANKFYALAVMLSVFFAIPVIANANNENAGPLCTYRDLERGNIVKFRCDRFQSKGDLDSVTPQLKIVSPKHGQEIDYSDLTDLNGNGSVELPITIVVSPNSEYTVDFTAASSARTEYVMLPQETESGMPMPISPRK